MACFVYSFLGNTTYGILVDGDRHPYIDLAWVHSELNCICSCLWSQVVHASFQPLGMQSNDRQILQDSSNASKAKSSHENESIHNCQPYIYYLWPCMEMKGCEFSKVGLVHVDVKTLALVNVSSSISSHVNKWPLLDFPHSPVK